MYGPSPAEVTSGAVSGMVPEDVFDLTGVLDPRVSPDGEAIAFSVWSVNREENEYGGAIWICGVERSTSPRRFTFGPKRDGAPRWSPDGSMLAFTSDRGEDKPQLFVIPVNGGEPRRLTDRKEGVGDPVWSPDGKRLAFEGRVADPAYAEEDERRRAPRRLTRLRYKLDNEGWTGDRRPHVFTVSADGSGDLVQVTEGDFEDTKPCWSPDGMRIAFASSRGEDWDVEPIQDIYVVDADGGKPELITSSDGWCDAPSWSPDGSMIAFLYTPGVFDEPRHGQVAVVEVSTGERRVLTTALDRNCAPYPELREPIWDGDRLVFAVEDHARVNLYRVASDGSGEPELVVGPDVAVTGYDLSGGKLAHTASTPTELSELYVGENLITEVGREFKAQRDLSEPERFVATSADGTEVEGWIMRPVGLTEGERCPVLLNIHGGPFAQYAMKFFDEFQVYAGAGYAVVFTNPRGSSGYTEEWARAIRGPSDEGPGWGSVDYEDVLAAVEEAVKRFDFCDPDRVGVMGGSYGGYLTSWIVGHTDRFQAAISERAVNQLVSMWGSSDFGWTFKGSIGAFLHEDMEAYIRMSPATYATEMRTPLLILHSENDLRCPIEQGEQLFTTLRLLKRDVEFVRFTEETHELSRSGNPRHRVMRFDVILEWLDRKLKGEQGSGDLDPAGRQE